MYLVLHRDQSDTYVDPVCMVYDLWSVERNRQEDLVTVYRLPIRLPAKSALTLPAKSNW